MEINLRKEIVDWLSEHGHWVVVRSTIVERLNSEVDRESGQPSIISRGKTKTGKPYVDLIVKSDRRKSVPEEYEVATGIGTGTPGSEYFFFEHYFPVKRGDLIFEIELDRETQEPIAPIKIRKVYKILDPQEMRDRNGRIEFFQCKVQVMDAY